MTQLKSANANAMPCGTKSTLGPCDVFFGKSQKDQKVGGNKLFRSVVEKHIPVFLASKTRLDKSTVFAAVQDIIEGAGGNFYRKKRSADGQVYYEPLSEDDIRDRIGRAFRRWAVGTMCQRQGSLCDMMSSGSASSMTAQRRFTDGSCESGSHDEDTSRRSSTQSDQLDYIPSFRDIKVGGEEETATGEVTARDDDQLTSLYGGRIPSFSEIFISDGKTPVPDQTSSSGSTSTSDISAAAAKVRNEDECHVTIDFRNIPVNTIDQSLSSGEIVDLSTDNENLCPLQTLVMDYIAAF